MNYYKIIEDGVFRLQTFRDPAMINLRSLQIETKMVEMFLKCSMKLRVDDDKDLKSLISNMSGLGHKAAKEHAQLQKIMDGIMRDRRIPAAGKLDGLVSNAQKTMNLLEPHMREAYSAIVSKQRPPGTAVESSTLLSWMDVIQENIEKVGRLFVPLRRIIDPYEHSLMTLKKFIKMIKNWGVEDEKLKDVLVHAYAVIESTSCVLYLCLHGNSKEEVMLEELKIQFQKATPDHPDARQAYIKALEASKSSQQIRSSKALVGINFPSFLDSLIVTIDGVVNRIVPSETVSSSLDFLRGMLSRLRIYLVDPAIDKWDVDIREMLKNLFWHVKALACDAACIVYSCYPDDWSGVELQTSELLNEYNLIKQEAKVVSSKMIPSSMRSHFPLTNEHGFLEFILENPKSLLLNTINSLADQIREVHSTILSVRGAFTKVAARPMEMEEVKEKWTRFIDVVHQTEYDVDSILLDMHHLWYHRLELFVVLNELKDIKEEIKGISTEDGIAVKDASDVLVSDKPTDYVDLFQDEEMKITEQLTNGIKQLYAISIVGMPGIGKTTLANAIYDNNFVQLHFHVCARCPVSQAYRKKGFLLEILQQVVGRDIPEQGCDDDDLAQTLYRSLKGKRYLILIDDIWDEWQWTDVQACFPDDSKGSRIVFTSRFQNIASQIGCRSITFPLHQLSDVKSWELLQAKVFQKESLPLELEQVSKRIASKCKGLPLAIDLIAGILRNMERKEECWGQLEDSLSKQLLGDQQGRCMDLLELSYKHLPDPLKPCFLYYGAFREEKEVMSRKLSWLWIAEGFIQQREDDSGASEDAAEKVLKDLVARSLVTVSKRRSDGGIKSTRLHDLLLEFALEKAKQEFFLQPGTSTLDSNNNVHVPYRLSASSRWDDLASLSKPRNLRIRSLTLSRFLPSNLLIQPSEFLKNLRLLRVLDLGTIELQDFPDVITSFLRLHFLSIRCYSNTIPTGIRDLMDLELETLILKVTSSRGIQLPVYYKKLKSLRHLSVHPFCEFTHRLFGKFVNLQTLSTVSLCFGHHSEQILALLPNLRKLSCIFQNSEDDSSHLRIVMLDVLSRLESLKLECGGEVQHPRLFIFPQNLRKLTLMNVELQWSELSSIGKLPNLQVVKLLRGSLVGES